MNYLTKAFPMPDVHDVPESAILGMRDSDAVLAIVSDGPETLRMWEHRIAALGLAHKELNRFRVPVIDSGLTIHAWSITSAP